MTQTIKDLITSDMPDDFLIGLVSSKQEALNIKEQIKSFLSNKLKLELNEEKTLITHAGNSRAKFLGTEIYCPTYGEEKIILREKNGYIFKQRKSSANIRINMDTQKVINKLKTAYLCDGSGKSKPKYQWRPYTHKEILMSYNAVISGIFNYFSFIENVSSLARIYNLLRSSAAKLLASKFKLKTQRSVFKKFGKTLKSPEGTSLISRTEWKKNPLDFKL